MQADFHEGRRHACQVSANVRAKAKINGVNALKEGAMATHAYVVILTDLAMMRMCLVSASLATWCCNRLRQV